MAYCVMFLNGFIAVVTIISMCSCTQERWNEEESEKDTFDNSFQHNLDFHLEESGEKFKLRSTGKLSDVIDLDRITGIKRLLCVDDKILLVLDSDDVVSSWKPGRIVLGSSKWGCNITHSTKGSRAGIYAKIVEIYFPTKLRASIHTIQAGPFDLMEEANIHFQYTPGNDEHDSVQTRTRRRRFLSNILTNTLGNIDWRVNVKTTIPFNQDDVSNSPTRYFVLHKNLGERNLSYSEYSAHHMVPNGTHDFTFTCHGCHGRSKVSYTFELIIKKVNNEPVLLKYISQLQGESHFVGDVETNFETEMGLTYNVDLWKTSPEELIRIPIAVVKSLPPVELTLSYSTHASASVKAYVAGKSNIRTSYISDGNYVISQQFMNGSNLAGDISVYNWNVSEGDQASINTKYRVNVTFDVLHGTVFSTSISWHETDIDIDLTPPMEIKLKTSTSVLSKDEGYSQCVTSSVNVTGHFRVSKAELEVEAFGLTIWDVVLHPQISKAFRMTSGTLHEVCAAHCHGQVQLGPPQAAADVCGKISGTISRQDPRFYELRGLHGDLLSFPSEPNSTWCGEPGGTCFKCTDDSPDPRQLCMHRLVSARMVAPLSKLAKLVQAEWQGEHLQVLKAWEEPTSENQHTSPSLHDEGRAAVVAVNVSGDDAVERLAQLAVCSGFDYVRIITASEQVEVAVKGTDDSGEDNDDFLRQMFNEAMHTADGSTTKCLSRLPHFTVGDTYPEGQTSEAEMCGPPQRALYRPNKQDMERLYHYTFRGVEFTPEKGDRWCGVETRVCRSCDSVSTTHSWDWCSTRMMTPRLALSLRTMAQTARTEGIVIKVLGSFLEESERKNDSHKTSDLYHEGRGIMVTTKSGNDIDKLFQHAVCAGFDYVRYTTTTYIEGFVLSQKDYQATIVQFLEGPLYLEVNPPVTLLDEYSYPDRLVDDDIKPLLVDGFYDQYPVSEHYKLTHIKDPGKRYVRFDNGLLECLELISDDLESVVEIVRGSAYRTRSTNRNNLDVRHREERWRFESGQAAEIRPGRLNSDKDLVDLAKSIFRSCTTFLRLDLRGIGVGCHFDRLYLDVRPLIEGSESKFIVLWNSDSTSYCDEISDLKDAILTGGPVIAPTDTRSVCSSTPFGDQMNYINFQLNQDELCDVRSRQTFCDRSRSARQREVVKLQERMTDTAGLGRLPRHEIMPEIDACLLDLCGGCPGAGHVWDKKTKACSILVHKYLATAARPFPNLRDKAAFYNTDCPVSSVHSLACHDGSVCVESVQLHSILMPLVASRFHPYEGHSQEEMLFSSEHNPTPVLELVEQEMAFKASGKVKVFIEEDKDMSSLRHVLKVLMVYNNNVTNVEFHVADNLNEDLVSAAIQRKIDLWSKSSCPAWSRFAVVPYTVHAIPPSRRRRSLERSKQRNEARSKIHNWEMEWLMKLL